jgi:hypothetical protein
MRSNNEYRQILQLWEAGYNKSAIERETGIPRPTVRDCIKKFGTQKELEEYLHREQKLEWQIRATEPDFRLHYAYMLGIYLGDGCISEDRRTYKLRVVMDKKYPNILNRVIESIQILVPNNSVCTVQKIGCIEIACYSNDWVEMFPQHGAGVKHKRAIILEDWQQKIVDEYTMEFVRGLYHSDGSRFVPVNKGKTQNPRYQFTNVSDDIQRLFCNAIEKFGLHWACWGYNVSINRKADVAFLDEHIGPKS